MEAIQFNIKEKKSKVRDCKNKIMTQILYQPRTFGELVNSTTCSSETIDKYVKELEKSGKISHKKSKFKNSSQGYLF